jgi:hypothetical protein
MLRQMIWYKCWVVLDFYKEPLVLKNKLVLFQFQLDTWNRIVNSILKKKKILIPISVLKINPSSI